MEGADLGYYASLWTAFLGISSINFVSSPGQRPCELLPSGFVRRPSYVVVVCRKPLSQFRPNLDQTLVEWSLDGPLPKLCPVIPASNQDGRQAKNRKKGG